MAPAYNGMAYGPPTSAYPYGTNGCPLAPPLYRSELGKTELPNGLCAAFGASRLTVADLGLEAWQLLNAHELSPESRQELSAFLYQLPVPEKKVAVPDGVPISWLFALPTTPRLRNALLRHFRDKNRNETLHAPISCEEFLNIRGFGNAALIEILCVLESVELGIVPEQIRQQKTPKLKVMSEAQFEAAIQEATRRALRASDVVGGHLQELAAWALSETDSKTVGGSDLFGREQSYLSSVLARGNRH